MPQEGGSPHWFRVARLVPRLRAQARVHRHVLRGQVWHVLQDRQTGRAFRLTPAGNLMLCLMDGRRTAEEVWAAAAERLGAERPSREDLLNLLIQLHGADLLASALPPDMTELHRRAEQHTGRRRASWFATPLALRFPLLDPDRFLGRTLPWVRPLLSRTGFALWLALVAAGLGTAVLHWPELSANVSDRVFTTYNVVMLLLLYPASKALHELGHAYAIKAGGGEVHEVGLMLLVFFPVPYVDGSGATVFPDRWRRMLVGAAGMMVELALAAAAAIAWAHLPPGLLRAAAFNLLLLCSVSTVLFNGNPLLRFDGYYVLGDWLGIPNLDARSRRAVMGGAQRLLFGLAEEPGVRAPGEAKWLLAYGVAAFCYRLTVTAGIALLISQRFFAIGVALAACSLVQLVALPLLRGARFVLWGRPLRGRRTRAVVAMAAVLAALYGLLFVLPLPYAAVVQGVVWVPEDAVVRARADGFVAELRAAPGAEVVPGQVLVQLTDPAAAAQVDVLRAEAAVAAARFDSINLIDLVQARLAAEQLQRAQATLARAEQRQRDLTVRAAAAGRFVVPDATHLPGRFVRNGEVVGYVIGAGDVGVRTVVPQAEIDLVRGRTAAVSLRLSESTERVTPARIVRQTPSALERAPAAALSSEGGGPMLLDPTSPHHDRPLDRWYEVVVQATEGPVPERIGAHAYVRFDLGAEPLAWRLLRSARQVFLRAIDV